MLDNGGHVNTENEIRLYIRERRPLGILGEDDVVREVLQMPAGMRKPWIDIMLALADAWMKDLDAKITKAYEDLAKSDSRYQWDNVLVRKMALTDGGGI